MPLPENTKLRNDPLANLGPRQASASGSAVSSTKEPVAQVEEAELAMRRALGLPGESPRHRLEGDRLEAPHRMPDRPGAGAHRRRFVQDGEIPVTILRRDPGHDAPQHRIAPAPVPPPNSRLQRLEAALAAETIARAQAERASAESNAALRDLHTKVGHADLARNEAVEALRHERKAVAALREELAAAKVRIDEVRNRAALAERNVVDADNAAANERIVRQTLEKSLRVAEAAREEAEKLARALLEEGGENRVSGLGQFLLEPVGSMAAPQKKRGRRLVDRQPAVPGPDAKPEPVKWWLTPVSNTRRRR